MGFGAPGPVLYRASCRNGGVPGSFEMGVQAPSQARVL